MTLPLSPVTYRPNETPARMNRCRSVHPSATLQGRSVRCEDYAGHDGSHGHSFAARYWDDILLTPETLWTEETL